VKKWIPFILILIIAVSTSFFLFIGGEASYISHTTDPAVIYRDACTGCHGIAVTKSEFLTPNLAEEKLLSTEVKTVIKDGTWRMPSFPAITDTVLDRLADYVANKKFLTK